MPEPLLRVTSLWKYFSGTPVLADVSLELGAGEILGLVGQNGSGKSTLIKCLSGYHSPDSAWQLEIDGSVITRGLHPGEPAALGISFVHQDLGVIGDLTVLENLLLERLSRERTPLIRWRDEQDKAAALLESFDLYLDPRARLSALRPVEQAQVAIVRAVMQLRDRPASHGRGTGVIVLDEATTFLDQAGRESLHALLRSIAATGSGVLFVSHDISEVLALASRVVVLRDGRVVETAPSAELSPDDIVGLIIGGDRGARLDQLADGEKAGRVPGGADGEDPALGIAAAADPIATLAVRDLTGPRVSGIRFDASRGEIVAITGIVGSGWEVVLEHLYGAQPALSGHLELDGVAIPLASMTPRQALGLGAVLVPARRLVQGIIPGLSLRDNVMQPVLHRSFRGGRLRLREMTRHCGRVLRGHAVRPGEPDQEAGTLSGGNQQKAVLAKWLQLAPRLVLLSEPTQGVDVGARQLIFHIIRAAAERGAIVVYASGDWDEVARLAHKVVVIADGRMAATLTGDDVTADRIAESAYRGTRRSVGLARAAAVVATDMTN
ncbi:MAG: sugar ABC transporter ATP-binding protein [Streptosporangiaceae bacterium]